MNNLKRFVLVSGALWALSGNASAQIPVVGPGAQLVPPLIQRLQESNVLLTDQEVAKATLAPCQPTKGTPVAVMRQADVAGFPGYKTAYVQVLEGSCKGQYGWVGLERLEASPAKPAQ